MDVMQWHHEALANRTIEALKKHEFDAVYIPDKDKAAEFVMGFVASGAKVGFGGSMTINQLGLKDRIKEKGATVLDHNDPSLSAEQKMELRRQQLLSDLFLTSVNAVTLDGHIFNIDANGNRVNAMTFGPKKVVIVVGMNKIRKDLEEAVERVKHYAAPMNNKRLGLMNPCTTTGTCMECESKTRICRIHHTLLRKPPMTDITVVLVGTGLGY